MAKRTTYTIPEPERSAFAELASKTGVSEAEHIRRYIRWACKLAGVAIGQPNVHALDINLIRPGKIFPTPR